MPTSSRIIRAVTFTSLILGALLLFPLPNFLWEVGRNFTPYFIFANLVCLVLVLLTFLKTDIRFASLASIALFLLSWLQFQPLVPFYVNAEVDIKREALREISIYYANVQTSNREYEKVIRQIDELDPDIVLIVELEEKWQRALKLTERFKSYKEVPFGGNFGIGLYSKFEFDGEIITSFGPELPPVIVAPLKVSEGRSILFAAVHAIPPLAQETYWLNRILFRRLATKLRHHEGDIVVAGDFNGTPYSRYYRILTTGALMEDSRYGYGYDRTWRIGSNSMRLTLDHILYRGDLRVEDFKTMPAVGSDHLPLFSRLSLLSPLSNTQKEFQD